jgi:outer membrane murein-binding lipoprotein Lpp
MNRRLFSIAAIASVVAIAGCDNDQKPSRSATVLNNSEIQAALQRLSEAIGTLEANVERFQSENWRDVVTDVEDATASVHGAFDGVRRALRTPES